MTLSSTEISSFGIIPLNFTFFADDVSPPLRIQEIPPTAVSLVLMMSDPDHFGPTVYHWIVFDIPIPPTRNLSIERDSVPAGRKMKIIDRVFSLHVTFCSKAA